MKRTWIYAHNRASQGARELAEALDTIILKHEGSTFVPAAHKTIINWGSSSYPERYDVCTVLNRRGAVATCANKKSFFEKVSRDCRVVPYTSDLEVAKGWIKEGNTVCARQKLAASGAEGLVIFDQAQEFVKAPLWTLYVKKKEEFRVHVIKGKSVLVQRKARTQDAVAAGVDTRIRNLSSGYIFQRNDIIVPEDVTAQALLAVKSSGLDFGAVDVIWNEKKKQAFVLEVNTAPGLVGSTVADYAGAFKELL